MNGDETDAARDPAVEICGLQKSFGSVRAVDGVDLVVKRGSFCGLVGPNGAGKTTTLSILTGLLRADAGTARVLGVDVAREPRRAKRLVGVLAAGAQLLTRLTGEQLIVHTAMLHGIPRADARTRARDLIGLMGLDGSAAKLVVDYSAGMQKKIALAAALVHAPPLLVLDEPFESVDPVSAVALRSVLEQFVAASGTVLVSSHSMDLVERMCDHVAVVVGGRVRASGRLDDVRDGNTLEQRFVELAGGAAQARRPAWLRPS